ncbi:hypothetical protein BVG19_g343 [[Candida] boidinii]|nr:hypothetical protein BVG19_g343 [[Candida] boidinii]OWB49532.1 hypothetical protein B5S27_g1073 [[Candida] boidinii]OWB81925.1 hypothetical protein B5S33_g545 [[Candida] boidinii]
MPQKQNNSNTSSSPMSKMPSLSSTQNPGLPPPITQQSIQNKQRQSQQQIYQQQQQQSQQQQHSQQSQQQHQARSSSPSPKPNRNTLHNDLDKKFKNVKMGLSNSSYSTILKQSNTSTNINDNNNSSTNYNNNNNTNPLLLSSSVPDPLANGNSNYGSISKELLDSINNNQAYTNNNNHLEDCHHSCHHNLYNYNVSHDDEYSIFGNDDDSSRSTASGALRYGTSQNEYLANVNPLSLPRQITTKPKNGSTFNGIGAGSGDGTSSATGYALSSQRRHRPEISLKEKIPYYLPCFAWMPNYTFDYFFHDLIAGLSLASYQIPLSMSFAKAVAHVPPICGLLGLSIAPLVYCLLGSVPQMIVGPEAACSMIVGQAIEKLVKHNENVDPIDLLCVIAFLSGSILLGSGLARFGFIDNVLCGALLRGFITAIGLAMIISSSISIIGIDSLLDTSPSDHHIHSVYDKFIFLISNLSEYHLPTSIVGITSFISLFILKKIKKNLINNKFKGASFIPEILIVVFITIILSSLLRFDKLGISIVGKIELSDFQLRSPISIKNQQWYNDLIMNSLMVAIIGFFESSTASKSLSSNLEIPISSNRELVALGTVGVITSLFGGMPSFGGYARSKLNMINGAKTALSGGFMGLTTLIITVYLTNYLYFLPNCVLNAITAEVGISLISETPSDVMFHLRTKGYNELITFCVTLLASVFYSVEIGVGLGCLYSLIRVIKHSTKSRIQILARIPGTDTFINTDFDENVIGQTDPTELPHKLVVRGYNEFRRKTMANLNVNKLQNINQNNNATANATATANLSSPQRSSVSSSSSIVTSDTTGNNGNSISPNNGNTGGNVNNSELNKFIEQDQNFSRLQELEQIEGCLIIKIPEPLTFTNTNDLKSRLKRIELCGSVRGLPIGGINQSSVRNIIFDVHGMTSIDSSAAQIMNDIIKNYQRRGINVFFSRVASNHNLYTRLIDSGIKNLLMDTEGVEFGIQQSNPPYYDNILDALKVVDEIEATCEYDPYDVKSLFSALNY